MVMLKIFRLMGTRIGLSEKTPTHHRKAQGAGAIQNLIKPHAV
jgi:hypothetical protein